MVSLSTNTQSNPIVLTASEQIKVLVESNEIVKGHTIFKHALLFD
jgi:hypothetical protein